MKIGIISINMYSKGLNYACPLHSWAFQQFLGQHGIESTIIDYRPNYYSEDFDLRHPADYYAARCRDFETAGRDVAEPEEYARIVNLRDSWQALYEEREIRYDKFQRFIETHYKKTDVCYDSDLLEVMDPGFDCYICCTDVIWRKAPGFGYDRGFFLACSAMEGKWKIAYAASAGVYLPEEKEDREQFIHYVENIDAVSVREESLARYLHPRIAQDVSVVLDPVLLQEREFYEELLVKPREQHYLFLYYVMEKAEATIEQAVKYARAYNLAIVEISEQPEPEGRLKRYGGEDIRCIYDYGMGIEDWLGYLRYADCVFTNSFHCCCFSILFEKQFFVGFRMGDKVGNLLETFGLSGRRFKRDDDLIGNPLPKIDYAAVRPILERRRAESADFILTAIQKMEHQAPPARDDEWWKRQQRYPILYNSGSARASWLRQVVPGEMKRLSGGSLELCQEELMTNNGLSFLPESYFYTRLDYVQIGWRIRFRIDQRWFWYLQDGTFALKDGNRALGAAPVRLFRAGERIPYIPVAGIRRMVAEACWQEEETAGTFVLIYNSGARSPEIRWDFDEAAGEVRRLSSGSAEYRLSGRVENDGGHPAGRNGFTYPRHRFAGWRMRVKADGEWWWLLEDGGLARTGEYRKEIDGPRRRIAEGEPVPEVPCGAECVVLEAEWEDNAFVLIYNSGARSPEIRWDFDESAGTVRRLSSGSAEYRLSGRVENDGGHPAGRNGFTYPRHRFAGWRMRVKADGEWWWMLEDGSLARTGEYRKGEDGPRMRIAEGEPVPEVPCGAECVVLEAEWVSWFSRP